MERDKPREVVYRRSQAPEGADAGLSGAAARLQAGMLELDDPADDLPVSNLAYDLDERVSAPPSYGEMGPPAGIFGTAALEPVGGLMGLAVPRPPSPAELSDDELLLDAWFA
ncbi:MAG: hypothetical protein HGA45_13555, partial [Chloroflexales bacterium]|nr:hypothetical protein [Chloroflexales bacterium]